nr:CoA transferase [Sedimentibacter sp.]
MSQNFLEGVKVLELATFIAAPACTRFLADLGATVIKIEATSGDPIRYVGPDKKMPLDQDESVAYDFENANKKGIALNIKTEEGMKVLKQLLDECDIFVTNNRTQALEKNGLDYETISKKRPEIVFGQILGYGEKGPLKDKPGFDFTAYSARGGWAGALYEKNTSPVITVPGFGDHSCGMYLASGVLAAYIKAKNTGIGDKVTVSLYHAAVYNLAIMIHSAQYGNEYPISRKEMLNPLQTTYKTSDNRWIQMASPEYNKSIAKFSETIERPELALDPKFDTLDHVSRNPQLLNEIISEAISTKTMDEWMDLFDKADLCCEKCQTWDEILNDEQAWASDILHQQDYPSGKKAVIRTPVLFKNAGLPPYSKGPVLGGNTDEILQELGYSNEDIKSMKEKKAVR